MPKTVMSGFTHNFLGNAPAWYKQTILLFLLINPPRGLVGRACCSWLAAGLWKNCDCSVTAPVCRNQCAGYWKSLRTTSRKNAPKPIRPLWVQGVVMAFPYTLVLGGVGLMSVIQFL